MSRLAMAILAAASVTAQADSLTVTEGAVIRSFEGVVLAIDQTPETSHLRFRAAGSSAAPVLPSFGRYQPPPPKTWSVAVDDFGADPVWSGVCSLTAQVYLEGAGLHFYMTCEATP